MEENMKKSILLAGLISLSFFVFQDNQAVATDNEEQTEVRRNVTQAQPPNTEVANNDDIAVARIIMQALRPNAEEIPAIARPAPRVYPVLEMVVNVIELTTGYRIPPRLIELIGRLINFFYR